MEVAILIILFLSTNYFAYKFGVLVTEKAERDTAINYIKILTHDVLKLSHDDTIICLKKVAEIAKKNPSRLM